MTDAHSNHELGLSVRNHIDEVCDRFESELRNGLEPLIENYLQAVSGDAQGELLRELLTLEWQLAPWQVSEQTFVNYRTRFPRFGGVVDTVFKEWQGSEAISRLEAAAPNSPQRFRHFQLKSELGRGNFGVVWQAWDVRLQRDVALKLPRKSRGNAADTAFFLREARVAAKLRHPNIVPVFEVNDEQDDLFIASELIEGKTLKDYLKHEQPGPRQAALLIAKIAQALAHAHSLGIVHRDLKPANVLIDAQGEPHITDFGLAKRDEDFEAFADGKVIGTPLYMAPEQVQGRSDQVDHRADIYSLGVMLYEILADKPPFEGDFSELISRKCHDRVPPLRDFRPEVSGTLESICLKCLEREPEQRYASASTLAQDLMDFVNGAGAAPWPVPVSAPRPTRRSRAPVWAATGALLLVIAWGGSQFYAGIGPAAFTSTERRVKIITDPPGCEVTVVPLDPVSGEPDPTRIQHAPRATPVTMLLPPADYLIVAVAGDQRFHEVFRRVPHVQEQDPYGHPHLKWKSLDDGVIQLFPIQIPPTNVSTKMILFPGADQLQEPSLHQGSNRSENRWRLPSFYIDQDERTAEQLRSWQDADGAHSSADKATVNYHRCVSILEREGKRPPSAAEMHHLLSLLSSHEGDAMRRSLPLVRGLKEGVWEWSSTKPGGPFGGRMEPPTEFSSSLPLRLIGCGSDLFPKSLNAQFLRSGDEYSARVAGIRGARSVKPRRTADDFLSPVSPTSAVGAANPGH